MDQTRYLILGAGPAGISAAEAIRRHDPEGRIVMVSADPCPALSPVLLTYWIAGRCSTEGLRFRETEWLSRYGVSMLPGTEAVRVDGQRKRVELSEGRTFSFDRLLLATGASPIFLPLPGHKARGVVGLRTPSDAEAILREGPPTRKVVIIGGGFVGLKLAFHLRQQGVEVCLFEKEPKLAPRMLDPESSQSIERTLRSHAIRVETAAEVAEILSQEEWVNSVRLKSGEVVPCDRVIQAVGVRPNAGFLKGSGIEMQGGVLVDAHMETNIPSVYAAGDVAMTVDSITGERGNNATWPAATRQGKIAGANMTGRRDRLVHNFPFNTIHLFDLETATAGYTADAEPRKSERFLIDRTRGYRKIVLREGRVIGFILVGDVRAAGSLLSRMKRQVPLPEDETDLLFAGKEKELSAGLGFRHGLMA